MSKRPLKHVKKIHITVNSHQATSRIPNCSRHCMLMSRVYAACMAAYAPYPLDFDLELSIVPALIRITIFVTLAPPNDICV